MNFDQNQNFDLDTASLPNRWQPRREESTPVPAASNSKISQAELQRYKQLQDYEKEKKELRASLLERCENGAQVERGELTVTTRDHKSKRMTNNTLRLLMGVEPADRWIARIEPAIRRHLLVSERPGES
jgi:hypothetical protein